jgi:hypothetical protein
MGTLLAVVVFVVVIGLIVLIKMATGSRFTHELAICSELGSLEVNHGVQP